MAITVGLSLVLAAMLGPRAFGVIAMALVFTNFIEMIQQQGMMPAIISRRTLEDRHADTAFWMVLGAGIICTALGVLAAPLWAGLNDLPELTPVIQVLALSVPLTSSVVVHEAILRRQLKFKKLAIRSWASVLAGGLAGVGAAVAGWGVWALVVQQLVMNAVSVAVYWGVSSWRPRMRFSGEAARDLWRYAARSSSSSLGLFLGGRVDIILAGALFGPVLVGLYRMGHRLATMVIDVTARSMQAVSLPGLASVQDDSAAFADRLLRMQRTTCALALPILGVLAGVAPALEHLLGPEWSGTAVAIRILAVGQALTAMTLLLGPALQARGRPGALALIMWLWSSLTAGALVLAASLGPPSDRLAVLCWAIVVASGAAGTVLVVVGSRVFGIPIVKILRVYVPSVVAGLSAVGAATGVTMLISTTSLVAAVAASLAGATVAVVVLALLDPVVRTFLGPLLLVTGLHQPSGSASLGRVTKRSQDRQPAQAPPNGD